MIVEKVIQKELQHHTVNKCPKRKVNCQHCNEKGMYKDIVLGKHLTICPLFPQVCPNNCGEGMIQRRNLSDHRAKCPFESVKCPFFEAGCKQVMLQKELAAHKASNMEHHLELMMITTTSKLQQISLSFVGLALCITQQLDTVDSNFQNTAAAVNNMKTAIEAMTTMLEPGKQYYLPLVKKDEFYKESPSFCIQPGYKMHVVINKDKKMKGTIYLERGEHDDKLRWPMPEIDIELSSMNNEIFYTVEICFGCGQIVNQLENYQTKAVIEEDIDFESVSDSIFIRPKTHYSCL